MEEIFRFDNDVIGYKMLLDNIKNEIIEGNELCLKFEASILKELMISFLLEMNKNNEIFVYISRKGKSFDYTILEHIIKYSNDIKINIIYSDKDRIDKEIIKRLDNKININYNLVNYDIFLKNIIIIGNSVIICNDNKVIFNPNDIEQLKKLIKEKNDYNIGRKC